MISFFNSQTMEPPDTFIFNPRYERGLDAMLIVYSLLSDHPASSICEQFISMRTGWFTTTFTLFEAKSILMKVYAMNAIKVSQKLEQFIAGPIITTSVDITAAMTAMKMADQFSIDLTDAVLLQAVKAHGALYLATDDKKLSQVCSYAGITFENPIDDSLRQQMVTWEAVNLPTKGLQRELRRIHQWLSQSYPEVAQEFWSQTGERSHLP